jgi:Oxidoreductase-like protein, N-terminal
MSAAHVFNPFFSVQSLEQPISDNFVRTGVRSTTKQRRTPCHAFCMRLTLLRSLPSPSTPARRGAIPLSQHVFVFRDGAWRRIPRHQLDIVRTSGRLWDVAEASEPALAAPTPATETQPVVASLVFPKTGRHAASPEIAIQPLPEAQLSGAGPSALPSPPLAPLPKEEPKTVIAGVEIPQRPRTPESHECCMSGKKQQPSSSLVSAFVSVRSLLLFQLRRASPV